MFFWRCARFFTLRYIQLEAVGDRWNRNITAYSPRLWSLFVWCWLTYITSFCVCVHTRTCVCLCLRVFGISLVYESFISGSHLLEVCLVFLSSTGEKHQQICQIDFSILILIDWGWPTSSLLLLDLMWAQHHPQDNFNIFTSPLKRTTKVNSSSHRLFYPHFVSEMSNVSNWGCCCKEHVHPFVGEVFLFKLSCGPSSVLLVTIPLFGRGPCN